MMIRSRIRLFAAIFFSVAFLVVLGYGVVIYPMRNNFEKLVFAHEFRGDLFELSLLQHEYVEHKSVRAATQWGILMERSMKQLNEQRNWTASELEMLQKMKALQEEVSSLVRGYMDHADGDLAVVLVSPSVLNQINALNQRLTDQVNVLSAVAIHQLLVSISDTAPIFFALILLLVFVGLVLLGILQRTVIGLVSRLESYTRVILQSDVGTVIDQRLLEQKDEVGSLARTLKEMRTKIQDSNRNLEARVAERTKDLEAVRLKAEAHAATAERLNRLTIGRELKMLELKKEIQKLKEQASPKK